MFLRNCTLLLLFLSPVMCSLYAQSIVWTDVSAQYTMPSAVKVFTGSRTSPALKVWYLDVDMNKNYTIKPYTTPAGREAITTFSQRYQALAAINGGYFDMTSGALYSAIIQPDLLAAKNITSVVRSGVSYNLTRAFWGMKDDRSMSVDWIYHFGSKVTDTYRFDSPTNNQPGTPAPIPQQASGNPLYEYVAGIGGGPCLVRNGQVRITYTEEVFWESGVALTERQPRTAIGYTANGHAILLVADGRQTASAGLTLPELADLMISLGCTNAMNLDGGGSSQFCVKNSVLNLPDGSTTLRLLPSILAVVPSDSLPLLPPVTYVKKFDTSDSIAVLNGAGWSASSLPGFWGSAPSQIVKGGDGSAFAEYRMNFLKPAMYKISLWWTAASNRAMNTPVFVYHQGRVDTVVVNQSINGNKWNTVGDFAFSGAADERIIISNAGVATSTYIVADGLRITSSDVALPVMKVPDASSPRGELQQNYPNPFNPATEIKYSIPYDGNVVLRIFDILGKEVAVLYEGMQSAGVHTTMWNAASQASGVYLCQLSHGRSIVTKKILLIK